MRILMIMPFEESFKDVHAACQQAVDSAKAHAGGEQPHPRADLLQEIELYRVDDGHGAVSIMDDLLKHMKESTLCIVDISGNNPNVLWELGYAMALEKPIIMLAQDVESAPFDVSAYRTLQYDRDNLSKTLVESLASEIAGVLEELPEVTAFPEEFGFARTLAMSMASPAYFLDADFNIRYMNEAAVALFLADKGQSAGDWVGRSLVSFINEFADRLLNLTEIEKNLQTQKETLWRRGNSLPAQPLNVERVVLDTNRYGIVEMQKTGIAVRDVNDNQITGWVVSFNCITSQEPERFEQFHENHKTILENRILCRGLQTLPDENPEISSDVSLEFSEFDWEKAEYKWASSYSEKQESFEYMARIMTSDTGRYGLKSVECLTDDFFDYRNTEYLQLHVDDAIVGLLRLHMHHELDEYDNLESDVRTAIQDGQSFADAGIYFPIGTPSKQRLRLMGRLLGRAVEQAEIANVTNLYAQVPKKLLSRYEEFGFSKAGEVFTCQGWRGNWVPIWVNNWDFTTSDTDMARRFLDEFENERKETESDLVT
jgi:nucleoside 2-deoxyribosyltransferase